MRIQRYIASDCNNVVDAERFRMQILRDVGKKVMEIQNGIRSIFHLNYSDIYSFQSFTWGTQN